MKRNGFGLDWDVDLLDLGLNDELFEAFDDDELFDLFFFALSSSLGVLMSE